MPSIILKYVGSRKILAVQEKRIHFSGLLDHEKLTQFK
jgi:hypothetical protein